MVKKIKCGPQMQQPVDDKLDKKWNMTIPERLTYPDCPLHVDNQWCPLPKERCKAKDPWEMRYMNR